MAELFRPDPHNFFPSLPDDVARIDETTAPDHPLRMLEQWLSHVLRIGAVEPTFVTLATASKSGVPSSRTVQLLDIEDDAVRFTTNFGSRKGVEILENPRAAVSLYWRETAQSVNFTGDVVIADDEENDRRFQEDDRRVQASRIASFHGKRLDDEAAQYERWKALYESGEPLERPDYWKWFRIVPDAVTFWEGHPETLNRRLHYALIDGAWEKFRIEA